MRNMDYTFIANFTVTDPDSEAPVEIEVWKDNESGGIFALDSSFADQVEEFYNPFNGQLENVEQKLW